MSWNTFLKEEQSKPYFQQLQRFISTAEQTHNVYPPEALRYQAFTQTPLDQIKVVIVGQDPYHQKDQAHGLSFSVVAGVKIPPSLNNVFKALQYDLGYPIPNHGNLTAWAKQGVFLYNTILTVNENSPLSHQCSYYQQFSEAVFKCLNNQPQPIVFILWGKHAQSYQHYINAPQHYIIQSVHPSPLSAYRGFLTSQPFSKANTFLNEKGIKGIQWRIENV